jgi:hypothetical protein
MSQYNSQQNNTPDGSGHVWPSLTPPLTTQINNQQQQQPQQQQQLGINANNNNMEVISSQPLSLPSWGSSISSQSSRNSEDKSMDELFDKIEDMICDYMRDTNRHFLHCRVLRWNLDDYPSRRFSAVVVINPPTT